MKHACVLSSPCFLSSVKRPDSNRNQYHGQGHTEYDESGLTIATGTFKGLSRRMSHMCAELVTYPIASIKSGMHSSQAKKLVFTYG